MNINEKKSFDVIVIGGGAAGMMAAITAASEWGGHDDLRA